MTRRRMLALAIIAGWLIGLGALAHRQLFRPRSDRFAEAALLVQPLTHYYSVIQGGQHIGFARSMLDTTAHGVFVSDFLVVDLAKHRAAARVDVNLSRTMRLSSFRVELGADLGPFLSIGTVSGDTALTVVTRVGETNTDTLVERLSEPILVPSVVPLAIALVDGPAVGRRYEYTVFDPGIMGITHIGVRIRAESLLVVPDSARQPAPGGFWIPAQLDTVKAWLLEPEGVAGSAAGAIAGWMDEKGRMVQATQIGNLELERTTYEISYENWAHVAKRMHPAPPEDDRRILDVTAIGAGAAGAAARGPLQRLTVRLRNAPLGGFDLDGDSQRLIHDTLLVARDSNATPGFTLPADTAHFAATLRPERFLQSDDSAIVALAHRLVGKERNPRIVGERITRWVHDSLVKRVSLTVPDAVQVLRSRRGDCNEHTQLFLALARAAGLPARGAAGLAYVDGQFYYHAWPEIWLGRWVPVDPTLGEFPADAGHLRFVVGDYRRQADLWRLVDALRIDVLSSD